MLYISNRGNLDGPNMSNENNPEYVKVALEKGYHVIVDTWIGKNKDGNFQISLGQIQPMYPVDLTFMQNPKIIARVKDVGTFQMLTDNKISSVILSADPALSSAGLLWPPGGARFITRSCVLNMPEWFTKDFKDLVTIPCAGVCSDYIESFFDIKNSWIKENEHVIDILQTEKLGTIPEENEDNSVQLDI